MLIKLLFWKVPFLVTSKPTPPTVFNLQALDCSGLGSLWRGNRSVYPIFSEYLWIRKFFFLQIFKVIYFVPKNMCILKYSLKFIIIIIWKKDNWAYSYLLNSLITSNYYISKILWGLGFSLRAPKRQFIFYNSFSLWLTENLHKQKRFLKTWSTCFVYKIFL